MRSNYFSRKYEWKWALQNYFCCNENSYTYPKQ